MQIILQTVKHGGKLASPRHVAATKHAAVILWKDCWVYAYHDNFISIRKILDTLDSKGHTQLDPDYVEPDNEHIFVVEG